MARRFLKWPLQFLLLLLLACNRIDESHRLVASAEKAAKETQLEAAADLYHKAAHLRPSDFDIQFRTAVLYLKLGNLKELEEHLKQALSLRPGIAAVHLNLGVVFLRKGNKEDGRKEFLEALRLDPRPAVIMFAAAIGMFATWQ